VGGSPTSAVFPAVSPGLHRFGVQGDCGAPDGTSTITEGTINLLQASPHSNPITGDVTCEFSAAASETTATWTLADPSIFVDVYVFDGANLAFVDSFRGNVTGVVVGPTVSSDTIVLQFFANVAGGCYGSPLFECVGGKQYIQGVCNGSAGETGNPDLSSAIFGLGYLFGGGTTPPCVKACETNGDGSIDLSDMVYLLGYLFAGGPPPTLWVGGPTCTRAAPEDDCDTAQEFCSS